MRVMSALFTLAGLVLVFYALATVSIALALGALGVLLIFVGEGT